METLPVTLVLAGAAAIFLVLISFPIANRRRATKLSAGDGGDEKFNRLIRAQANFAEYTPLAVIVIGLIEMNGFAQIFVCSLAAAFAVGRVLHLIGMVGPVLVARALGMILTFGVLLTGGAALVWHSYF
jgi:uncharacterized membrane protein YecN with MAPEG domain